MFVQKLQIVSRFSKKFLAEKNAGQLTEQRQAVKEHINATKKPVTIPVTGFHPTGTTRI